MALDPIIPLTITLAEKRRTVAFFLGSGVSRAAGIPTGSDVATRMLRDAYRASHEPADSDVPQPELQKWAQEHSLEGASYSELFSQIGIQPGDRHSYLMKFFDNETPTQTHRLIAGLVGDGYVTTILTTNFDRLMEKALDEKGLPYDAVSNVADLSVVQPREHSRCRILKLHGDWHRLDTLNTRGEVSALDPAIRRELDEILCRNGILVMGYSGEDPAILDAFRARKSRYGLFWLCRGTQGADNPAQKISDILALQDGRPIFRPDADAFMRELSSQLKAFELHQTGENPEAVRAEAVDLLRRKDQVGWRELTRRLHRQVPSQLDEWRKRRISEQSKEAIGNNFFSALEATAPALVQVMTAAEHGDERRMADCLGVIDQLYLHADVHGWDAGLTAETRVGDGLIYALMHWAGALAARSQSYRIIAAILYRRLKRRENSQWHTLIELTRLTTWPASLPFEGFDEVFDTLLEAYHSTEWLNLFFGSYQDYVAGIGAYNIIGILLDNAKIARPGRLEDANKRVMAHESGSYVPPLLICRHTMPIIEAMAMAVPSVNDLAGIGAVANVHAVDIIAGWKAWKRRCLKNRFCTEMLADHWRDLVLPGEQADSAQEG